MGGPTRAISRLLPCRGLTAVQRIWDADLRRTLVKRRKNRVKQVARERLLMRRIFAVPKRGARYMRQNLSALVGEPGYVEVFKNGLNKSSLLSATVRGLRFPRRPVSLRSYTFVRHSSDFAAIEYTAGMLLPDIDKLIIVERVRNGWAVSTGADAQGEEHESTIESEINELERQLGFSLWLSSIRMASMALPQLSEYVRALLDVRINPVVDWALQHLYHRTAGSYTPEQVVEYISGSDWPRPAKHFLLAVLHPAPTLTPRAVRDALSYASMCSAIDQWTLLLKCCQSLYVVQSIQEMRNADLLRDLLQSVPSVESYRLLTELFPQVRVEKSYLLNDLSEIMPIELELSGNCNGTFSTAFHKAGGKSREEALGVLASLSKDVLRMGWSRQGALLHSVVSLLCSLTGCHPMAQRWLKILSHPDAGITARSVSQFLFANEPAETWCVLDDALEALRSERWEDTLDALHELPVSREVCAIRLGVHLGSGDNSSAVKSAAHASVEHPTLLHRLPLAKILSCVNQDLPADIEEAVARTVIFDLGVRYVSGSYSRSRNESIEDLLEIAGVSLPSEMLATGAIPSADAWSSLIPYVLLNVCVPSTLDTIPVGSSTRELYEERIRILQMLLELGLQDPSLLKAEIVTVSAELAVIAERKNLDQQRVYVDVEGLSARLPEVLRSDFELYRQCILLGRPRSQERLLYYKRMREIFDMPLADFRQFLSRMDAEADQLLLRMLERTRTEFALSRDYGLDGYLSGGIRHGNLEALLREPFCASGILGVFDGERFVPPELCASICDNIPDSGSVLGGFRKLAVNFQQVVDEVLAKWIRINTEKVPEELGFFDLTLRGVDVRTIENSFLTASSVDAATEICLSYWRHRVNVCLEAARKMIRVELKRRLEKVLDDFIHELSGSVLLNPIVDNFVAPTRAGIERAMEELAGWFQVAQDEDAGTIDLGLLLAISRSTIENLNRGTKIEWILTPTGDDVTVTRKSMKHWVDILLTLFHNVIHHSGQRPGYRIAVTVGASTSGTVQILVGNPLGPTVSLPMLDAALEDARHKIASSEYLSAVQKEGKTGLRKILKTAIVDLRAPGTALEFAREGDQFSVKLQVPAAPCVLRKGKQNEDITG